LCFWIKLWSTGRSFGYENFLFDSQLQQNLRWAVGFAIKLDILCCWMIFRLIITLLLAFIAFNREKGASRSLRKELQPSFKDGLWACCGFRCRFLAFWWTFIFLKYFLPVLWRTWIFRPNSRYNYALRPFACFFKVAQALDDERAHFWPTPIFLFTFFCFSNLLILR
jgi:hypothetical protein